MTAQIFDEKDMSEGEIQAAPSTAPSGSGDSDAREVRRAIRKIDSSVLPLLVLGLLVFQLDRMNLGSAITANFEADINIDQSTVNLGNQLMFMAIVVLEIPSNILLQRVGPRLWIAGQVLVFGFVATMQIFVKNRGGFLATRLMLGFCESGYIPGASYTLSLWYTKTELAKRIGILFFGMFGGNALSPLLASGILKLDGHRGLAGWKWLFLIEGVFTMAVAFLFLAFLPGSPATPRPLLTPGIIRFSPTEQRLLQTRAELAVDGSDNDDAATNLERHKLQGLPIPPRLVWETVTHYRRWPHYISTFCVFSTWSPLTTYTPSIVLGLGFSRVAANALAAVGAGLAVAVVFAFAVLSDRTRRRGLSVIAAQLCYLITLIAAYSLQPRLAGASHRWSRWGLWTAVNAFAVGYHPNHNAWVQLNCRDPRERSIAVAMWVMSAISGLMAGAQYFRASDAPLYQNGLRTMIIIVSIGILFAVVQEAVYFVHNRRVAQKKYYDKDRNLLYTYVL